tara:strand:+ start:263 stop:454 length:192 start_codon:yes stop_codon:yes gene_type:complete
LEEINLEKEESKIIILTLKIDLERNLKKSIKIHSGTNKEQINYNNYAKIKNYFINYWHHNKYL